MYKPSLVDCQHTPKKLVCFDFDGTLTATNAFHQLYIFKVQYHNFIFGLFWRLIFLVQLPYFFYLYKTDNARFNRFLYSRYKGMKQAKLNEILRDTLAPFLWRNIFPKAEILIQQYKKENADIVIISASWSLVVAHVAKLLGVKYVVSTELEVKNGFLTGNILELVDGEGKAHVVNTFILNSTEVYDDVIAYGNSNWDIPMLECADTVNVINPNSALSSWAHSHKGTSLKWRLAKRHWSIGFFMPVLHFYLRNLKGWHHIPKSGGCIVIANHTSYLDHYILYTLIGLMTGRRAKYIAKVEHFKSKWFAKVITYMGAYPIDRDKGGRAALHKSIELVSNGDIVVIYPEGTRSRDGELCDFKSGVVLIQEKTGAPILPLGLTGAYEAWTPGQKYPTKGAVDVAVGATIPSVKSTLAGGEPFKVNKAKRAYELNQTVAELCQLAAKEPSLT